jgi:hypothetical protein
MKAVIVGVLVLASVSDCGRESVMDPCATVDCGAHGACVAASGGARCECEPGYQQRGSRCEEALDAGAPDAYVAGCGSGVIDPGERCDGDDLGEQTCASRGFAGGTLACKADCTAFDTRGCQTTCGDGLLGGLEVCDGADFGGAACATFGYYAGSLRCAADCATVDVSGCAHRCGDFEVDVDYGEQCDRTSLGSETCESLGYYRGEVSCQDDCQYDVSGCHGYCGDGFLDAGHEVCDGTEFGGKTCVDYGFATGWLTCNYSCDSISTVWCR